MNTRWASAVNNGDFIGVDTYSGLGRCGLDALGIHLIMNPDTDDQSLGTAIVSALEASRTLTLEEYGEFFNLKTASERYEARVSEFMERFNYKSRKLLFRNMKRCHISLHDGLITIRPSHHEKLEAWSGHGISKDDRLVLSFDSSSADIGAALRLAFSRCT
ncbi:hypothetical protein FHW69_000147 [Luteibacter sp. Sphag1AF]|uniref:contact-dependent growth inhibition system immunity protein n=1 Tax=Luteibacter sp. Sphag1AF TaxID=2587031 RepID=UPI001614302D|nr:contact-dependent growth inhibition system immunity protein [Luteibacter sp. Sphag1AF]MBB3225557.1 hypothetical protein [Luteibacter sp. Sphag1AF]